MTKGLSLTRENFYRTEVFLENVNRIEYVWNRGPHERTFIDGENVYRIHDLQRGIHDLHISIKERGILELLEISL